MVFTLNTGGTIQMKLKKANELYDEYLIYVEELINAMEVTGHLVEISSFPDWLDKNGYMISLKEFKEVKNGQK